MANKYVKEHAREVGRTANLVNAEIAAIYERIAENDRRHAEGGRQKSARNRQRALAGDALSTGMRGTLLTPLLGAIGMEDEKKGLLGF